jgi:hypothetical protein
MATDSINISERNRVIVHWTFARDHRPSALDAA